PRGPWHRRSAGTRRWSPALRRSRSRRPPPAGRAPPRGRSRSPPWRRCRPTAGSWRDDDLVRALARHVVERRPAGDEALRLHALLELADEAPGVLHHPPPHVGLVDRLPFLRVLQQVDDAGEPQRHLGVVEVL